MGIILKKLDNIPIKLICIFTLCICFFGKCSVDATEKYVATIEGKSYTSLQKAINEAKTGQTVTVTSDITTTNDLVMNVNGTIEINFAGNLYSYNGSNSAILIKNGKIIIRNCKIFSTNYVFNVEKGAELNIKNGTFNGYHFNKGVMVINGGTYLCSKAKSSQYDEMLQNEGSLTINGGKFSSSKDNTVWNKKTLIINDGTFASNVKNNNGDNYPTIINQGTCTINGGKFSGNGTTFDNRGTGIINRGSFISSLCTVDNTGKLTINGGSFRMSKKERQYALLSNTDGTLVINKGSFVGCVGNCGGKVTINDGTFDNANGAVICNFRSEKKNATTVINGGKFTSVNHNTLYNIENSTLKINGGTFKCTNNYYTLANYAKAYLKGGTFSSKENSNTLYSTKGSTLTVGKNVKYTGKIDYK